MSVIPSLCLISVSCLEGRDVSIGLERALEWLEKENLASKAKSDESLRRALSAMLDLQQEVLSTWRDELPQLGQERARERLPQLRQGRALGRLTRENLECKARSDEGDERPQLR